jgi:DNA modification methylase
MFENLPINQVVQGDCREVMQSWPDSIVDLVLTDPPYNISRKTVIRRKGGKFGVAKDINLDFGAWDHSVIKPEDWVPLAVRKLKPCGVFVSLYDKRRISHFCDLLEQLGMTIRHIAGWHKLNPAPQARKVKWQDALELFVIATKNKGAGHHYNYREGQHHDVIATPICQGNERLGHPTQKPEALFEPIVRWWSYPNDLVVDPFVGVGTSCVVAKRLGRRFIGIEIDEKYAEVARRRLAKVEWPLESYICRKPAGQKL